MKINFTKYKNELIWANNIADKIISISEEKRRLNQNFNIILQGGNTPMSIYDSLIKKNSNWEHWKFWIGDERMCVNNFNDFNYINIIKIFSKVFFEFYHNFEFINPYGDFIENCNNFNKRLSSLNNIDVALIGLGNDGHIASLFPPFTNSNDNCILISNSPKPPCNRISLTTKMFSKSDYIFFNLSILNVGDNFKNYFTSSSYPAFHIHPRKETQVNSY